MEDWVQELSEKMDRTAEQVKLKEKIRSEWSSIMKSDQDLTTIIKKITEGKATYEEVEELSYRVGKDLGKSLLANLEQTIPAGAKVPDDIYEVILGPVLKEGHGAVIEAAKKVQEEMNKRAGIGLKAQTADFDEDRAKGLAEKLKSGIFEDTKWVLDEPVALFHQSSADRTLKKNVKFQARAGLHPKITRKATGGCCKWCQALAGTYDYGDEPNDIYRRHQRCQCVVDFRPGDGKRQNVWSKTWHDDSEPEEIEIRMMREKELINKRKQKTEEYKEMRKRKSLHGKKDSDVMQRIIPIKNTPDEIKELCDYAESFGIKIVRPDKLKGDISMAKEQISMVAYYSKEYRITPPAIRFESMDLGTLGSTSREGTSIAIQNNALRKRTATNAFLNSDNKLAATEAKGISVHEMGHVLSLKYGDVGIEIAKKTYYNLENEEISDKDLIIWLNNHISEYSTTEGELISEILSKDATNPDSFTTEFIRLLKERWGI